MSAEVIRLNLMNAYGDLYLAEASGCMGPHMQTPLHMSKQETAHEVGPRLVLDFTNPNYL